MSLPIFQTTSKDISMLQTNWSSVLNPVVDLEINQGHLIKKVSLTTGTNQVNHGLQREIQGWIIVRQRGAASIYDTQDSNLMSKLTLSLVSSAPVSLDLFVF